jgi:AraC-like DNA-binding protein/mannose-6-phosphate isomerase-like protein (cupin superfamily)
MRYLMRYLPAGHTPAAPQLLQLFAGGRRYTLSILHATLEERRPAGSAAHAHALYHIVLFTRGGGSFLLGGAAVRARPGLLVLTGPGEPHDFGSHGGGELAYREVTFELRDGADVLRIPFHEVLSLYAGQPVPQAPGPVLLDPPLREEADDLFRRLIEDLLGESSAGLLGAYAVLGEMLALAAQRLRGSRPHNSPVVPPLERAQRLIERRCMEPIELADVAAEAHLAPAYLCRAFKRRFGTSPLAYHQEQRMQAARRMLMTTTLSCKEIAARLGYADVFTFSKAFKRVAGASPSLVRLQAAR